MPDETQVNDPNGCNAILIPKINFFGTTRDVRLAMLSIITEKTWETIKEQGSSGGGFDFFDYFSISADSTWDDFQQRRREYFETHGLAFDEHTATVILQSSLDQDTILAWSLCKGLGQPGFKIWRHYADAQVVVVGFRLDTIAGQASSDSVVSSVVVGGSRVGAEAPNLIFPQGHTFIDEVPQYVTFSREADRSLVITVALTYSSGALAVPPHTVLVAPEPEPRPEPVVPVWSEWAYVDVPPSGVYNGHIYKTVSVTVPEGHVVYGSPEYSISWGDGYGGAWGAWSGEPVFSTDHRTVSRTYDNWKHDRGRTIGIRVQYISKA